MTKLCARDATARVALRRRENCRWGERRREKEMWRYHTVSRVD